MSCQPNLNRKWSHRCAQNQNEANGSRKNIISRLKGAQVGGWSARCSGNIQRTWQLLSESICSVSCQLYGSGEKNRLISLFLVLLLSVWLPWSLFLFFFFWSHIFEVVRSPRYLRVGASSWCSGGGRVRVRRALSNFWASLVKAKHLSLPRSTSAPLSLAAQGLLMGLVPAV